MRTGVRKRWVGIITTALAGVVALVAITTGAYADSSTNYVKPSLGESHAFAKPQPAAATPYSQTAQTPQQASVSLTAPQTGDPAFITIGGGWFDVFDNEQAVEFRAEWRSGQMYWIFKPFAGAMFNSDASIYGYAGFLTDFYFGRRIVVSPSIAFGLYEEGDGKDLGHVVEFRSGLEVGWRFDNRSRLSVMLYHLSNASISDTNPGTEVVSVGYSFPLN
jgi:hypothetical protein